MASSSTHGASSSSTVSRNYDVFLSFTGGDTRKNFTDHLYTSLTAYGIQTFRDDEEIEKGGDIASNISRAIEESKIFLIIFSTNYAYSRWCLNELVKIIEVKSQKEIMVLPIFYHVDPSDVRNQRGSFGDALAYHKRNANQEKKEMMEKWRNALREAANLSGCHVVDQHETVVAKEIIDIIRRRLNHQPLNLGKNIVGIDVHLQKLKSLMNKKLNKVSVIGIYGIGGAGKTTVAKAIYNEISHQYDGSSFLRNIKERSKSDILQLQQELLHGILKGKSFTINNIDEGTSMIKRCLSSNRVLVVFDDVDELSQLEYLAEEKDWFKVKSTIIITSRDKQVLARYGANISYEVPKVNKEEAFELFSLWAFKQKLPEEVFKNLSCSIVDYANGLPLALKVLGASLFGKKLSEWESALSKLKTTPHMEIHNVLKISFDGLDDVDQRIFLDIACFFKGNDKYFVSRILGPYAEHGITTLADRCLITILKNKLDMHDLIQQMGWEIIRQECPDDPGRRSRLWDSNAYDVLTRNTGTQAIKGLFLDKCESKPLQLTVESFKLINRLRLLKIHNPHKELFLEDHLPRGFEFSSCELTYLHWDGYSLESLPMNFHATSLVELSLRNSNIKQLWRGSKLHDKLKFIDLSYSTHLMEIPDFSSVPNLESLILEGCGDLAILPRDIDKLKQLRTLSCKGCSKLERFPEVNSNMRKLRVLDLSETAIMDIPLSITHLHGLQTLLLNKCSKLHKIPIHICRLSSLEVLDLGHSNIMEGGIPSDICHLSSLRKLNLGGGHFSSIPATINQLFRLKALNLSHCNNLEQIPELPSSLRLLDAHDSNCTSSRALFLPLHSLVNCFSRAKDLKRTRMSDSSHRGKGTCIVLPGRDGIPEWITDRRNRNSMLKDLPQNWHRSNEFLGFAIFFFFAPVGHKSAHGFKNESEGESDAGSLCKNEQKYTHSCSLKCFISINGGGYNHELVDNPLFESDCFCHKEDEDEDDESVSGQTLVICYSKEVIGERFRSDEWTQSKISARYQDLNNNSEKAFEVKECGVRFVYSNDLLPPPKAESAADVIRMCSECQQDATLHRNHCFNGSEMSELPIIMNHSELDRLCLKSCKNLKSLPSSICDFKSLEFLSCSSCSKLKRFPEILQDMESLRYLYLDETAIKEIPSSIHRLKGLQTLSLIGCKNLVNLPESICDLQSLKILDVSYCPKFNKLADNLGKLHLLEHLLVGHLGSTVLQLPSLSGLCSLRKLKLDACNLREIPSEICQLSSLESLNLRGNHFSCIPNGINQLYKLKHLDLSYCKMLQYIPQLPSGLMLLDAHHCASLQNLLTCLLDPIQGLEEKGVVEMFVPGSNGIPEWISRQKNGFKMTMELPGSWYKNDDFLGFVLCSLYGPFDTERMKTIKSSYHREFCCDLNLYNDSATSLYRNDIWSNHFNDFSYQKDESNRVWLIYYSKSNIPKKFHSNGQRAMEATFTVSFGSGRVQADRCGFHFLYAHDYERNNLTMEQGGTSLGDLGRHGSVAQNINNIHSQRSCDARSSADGVDHSITQNIDDNGVDAQDHEMDHIHRWLEILCKFIHWI